MRYLTVTEVLELYYRIISNYQKSTLYYRYAHGDDITLL